VCVALQCSATGAIPFAALAFAWTPSMPARLRIQLSKFFGLLTLASSLQGNICFVPANCKGPLPGLGAEGPHGTGSTGGITKLDLDHFLIPRAFLASNCY
jgi:hypothetical protein